MNINLNYIKKKVFLSEDFVPWEHEQFSKRKIISATLSTLNTPPENVFTRNLFTDIDMDLNIVSKNIKFIVESLLEFLFDYDNTKFALNEIQFYENNSGDIKIYTVKSKIIDLYLLLGILIYLLFIYIYIKGLKGTFSDIKNIFSE